MAFEKEMKLIKSKLTPEDAHEISWALFGVARECRAELEDMKCKKCWERHNKHTDYLKRKSRLEKKMKRLEHAEKLFRASHGWDMEAREGEK